MWEEFGIEFYFTSFLSPSLLLSPFRTSSPLLYDCAASQLNSLLTYSLSLSLFLVLFLFVFPFIRKDGVKEKG